MSEEYELVPSLTRASLGDYEELFARVYGSTEKLSERYLHWLYCDNPCGEVVGVDAYWGDKLAAHYATIPRLYRFGDRIFRVLLSVNTATSPDHQRKGLFKKTASETYRRASESGFDAVVGVANAQSIHGFLSSLGFSSLGQVSLEIFSGSTAMQGTENQTLRLQQSAEWLNWRLSQPSARYVLGKVHDDTRPVLAKVGRAIFNLGEVSGLETGPFLKEAPLYWKYLALTPKFPSPRGAINLPKWLVPSPWHVIVRPLACESFLEFAKTLELTGLDMDSF